MRIVDRKTFLALPAGTIFAKFNPHCFGELQIKEYTTGDDFVVQHLCGFFQGDDNDEALFATLERMMAGGEAQIDFDSAGRDGFFDRDQLFGVLDDADTEALIQRLIRARDDAHPNAYGT